ncbi:MAG: hypothetical protein L3J54_02215 [Draconibacterium sp.]|nr:hypothetical protein [Draconibacterium sp.]
MKSEKKEKEIQNVESEFVPQPMGTPDLKRKKRIIEAYENVLISAMEYQIAITYCIKLDYEDEKESYDLLIESLKSNNTRDFLTRKYIERENLSFPGLSVDKLIENDLISTKEISNAVEMRQAFDIALEKAAATKFHYRIEDLNTDGKEMWELTPDFLKKVNDFVTRFTKNEKQNIVLKKFNNLCDSLNELSKMKIINPKHGTHNVFSLIDDCLEISRFDEETPFTVTDVLFYRRQLNKFK